MSRRIITSRLASQRRCAAGHITGARVVKYVPGDVIAAWLALSGLLAGRTTARSACSLSSRRFSVLRATRVKGLPPARVPGMLSTVAFAVAVRFFGDGDAVSGRTFERGPAGRGAVRFRRPGVRKFSLLVRSWLSDEARICDHEGARARCMCLLRTGSCSGGCPGHVRHRRAPGTGTASGARRGGSRTAAWKNNGTAGAWPAARSGSGSPGWPTATAASRTCTRHDARQVLPGDPYSLRMRSLAAFHLPAAGSGRSRRSRGRRTGVTGRSNAPSSPRLPRTSPPGRATSYEERSRDAAIRAPDAT